MRNQRLLPALLTLGVIAALVGCENERAAIVASYPFTGPYIGGRPKPSPFKLPVGNIRGSVFGEDRSQAIGMAFVTTGSVSTTAANPQQDQAITAEEENLDDLKEKIYVMHDFGDGTPVLSERRKRLKPGGPNPVDRYVYLKPGEFFLEEVPDGIATLRASYGGVTSQQIAVEVYAGNTRADINIPLYIPRPITVEGNPTPPKVVDYVSIDPPTGISTTVQIKVNEDGTRDITVDYKPNPPDITVYLKSPPGSAGTIITGINLVYSWDTIGGKHGETNPVSIPISPRVVAPAQDTAYGPSTDITVPVGSAIISKIFDQTDETTGRPDPPGLIICTMEFVDQGGYVVLNKDFQNLQVSCILRRL